MAKKRARKSKKPTGKRGPGKSRAVLSLVVVGAGAALAIGAYFLFFAAAGTAAEIPDPDRSLMEPQVAAKIQNYRQEVLKSPRSHEAWGDYGVVLHAHGLEQDATICYRKAIELAPSDFRWHYLLVQAYLAYDHEAALKATEGAIEVSMDYPPLLITRAELLEERNETEGVTELYQRALKISPDSAAAEMALGRIAVRDGDLETARAHLERAALLSPDAGAVHAALARLYRRLGEDEKATHEAELVRVGSPTVPVDDPIRLRMRGESVASTALLSRARDLVDEGDLVSAEGIYRNLVTLRPDDAAMKVRLGDVLSRQGRFRTAMKYYQEALAINSDDAAAHFGLGAALTQQGAHSDALTHFEKSLEVRGSDVPTLVTYASTLALVGRADEAEKQYELAVETEPENALARRAFAEFLFARRRYPEAITQYLGALQSEPDLGTVHLQLGAALAATGDYPEARTHLERARELGETVPDAVSARVDAGLRQR